MLETKRINAYGKRSSRIVYVSSDPASHPSPFTSHQITRKNNGNVTHSPSSAHKGRFLRRKVHGLSTSPRGSPKSGKVLRRVLLKNPQSTATPRRCPLVPKIANALHSSSIVYLGEQTVASRIPSPVKVSQFIPFVDSDAKSIEELAAKRKDNITGGVSQDEAIEVVRPPRKRAQRQAVIVTDDEEEPEKDDKPIPRRRIRGTQFKPIIVSDDSSDDYPAIVPETRLLRAPKLVPEQKAAWRRQRGRPHPDPIKPPPHVPDLPIPLVARPPSPRRSQRKVLLPSKNRAPNIPTPDLEIELLAAKPKPRHVIPSKKRATANLQYLAPLLTECKQNTPHCFSSFIETFPFDDIHGRNPSANLSFRKIGEASYSEVFAIGNVVLKIVPLRNESATEVVMDPNVDMPQESDTKDVLQEVIVTRTVGRVCQGFVKLLNASVVTGAYPSLLLSLWDTYRSAKGSENIRPDVFPQTQAYAILVLPHGGSDLETYTFPVKTGWRQACSLFWQTAKALATAEDLVSFEHRDLHWGQILVKTTRKNPPSGATLGSISMDDPSHGVTATIIDLGFARMETKDGGNNHVHWTAFDEIIFEGEGDYQFDVYRMMQSLHGDTWNQYRPLTNIMWLHYLLLKLLHAKRLRPPGKRYIAVDGEFNEKQCYESLWDMEERLRRCISQTRLKKGGAGAKTPFSKVGDIVEFAKGKGWVS